MCVKPCIVFYIALNCAESDSCLAFHKENNMNKYEPYFLLSTKALDPLMRPQIPLFKLRDHSGFKGKCFYAFSSNLGLI